MGNGSGMRNATLWKRAERRKSCFEYSPLSGMLGKGPAPVALNAAPSSIGRQVTPRPFFAASSPIFCAAR
ncbi:hypothetical protein D3C83_187000 [compost metagenome]